MCSHCIVSQGQESVAKSLSLKMCTFPQCQKWTLMHMPFFRTRESNAACGKTPEPIRLFISLCVGNHPHSPQKLTHKLNKCSLGMDVGLTKDRVLERRCFVAFAFCVTSTSLAPAQESNVSTVTSTPCLLGSFRRTSVRGISIFPWPCPPTGQPSTRSQGSTPLGYSWVENWSCQLILY